MTTMTFTVGPRGAKGAGFEFGHGLPPTDQPSLKDIPLGSGWLDLDTGRLYGPLVKTGRANDVTFGTEVLFDFGTVTSGSGGLTVQQVQALVQTAVAGLQTSAQVQAAITAALASLPPSGLTVGQVNTAIATALASYEDTAHVTSAIAAALALTASPKEFDGITVQSVAPNSGTPGLGVTMTSVFGIDSTGRPYYNPDGVAPGDEAALLPDLTLFKIGA